jgi:alpha-mannosidase
MLTELHVVTHTHWDREWYHTAERFQQRLVRLIDDLLDAPPDQGDSFLLDGQAVLLDDYLDVRPERAAELSALLREGRLEAGPWYVLADELIPGGEALVRNLLLGRATLRRLRGTPPPVLYCPDSFGHPAILPDLATGFDCDVVLLWRGYGGARAPRSDVARWRSITGAEVLLYHLPPDGYEFGSALPSDDAAAIQRWNAIAAVMGSRALCGAAILLNGADHHARQRNRDDAIAALARAASPVVVRASSLATAAAAVRAAATRVDMPEVAGELRDSYGYTWTLQGTLATRAAQKRRNARAERRLVCDVEPWIALAADGGDATTRALLRSTWRTLQRAHPHDTLCGTSIDAVAHAFDARLASAESASAGLREDALLGALGHDRERARADATAWKPVVAIRNRVARPRSGVVELTLRATIADVAVGPGSGARQGVPRRVPPWRVDGVPIQLLGKAERIELTESPRSYPDADRIAEVRAVGWVGEMRGYVVQTIAHGGRTPPVAIPHSVHAEESALDNGRIRIEVSEDGRVTFIDHERSRRIDDLFAFERRADGGDLYTPSLRELLDVPSVRRVRLTHRGPLRGEISIEYAAVPRRGALRVAVQLDADSRALRVIVRGTNADRDQRLRARFASGLRDASTLADAAFLPVVRAALEVSDAESAMEHVVPTAPLHRWVALCADDATCALGSDGLAEYETTRDGDIFVTLVRSVGELSRADLPERPGHAGWPAPAPDAQSLGDFEARFALQLFRPDGPETRDAIAHFAEEALLPLVGETLRSNVLDPRVVGGLDLHGDGLHFSCAMPAQQDGWVTLRCANYRDASVAGEWRLSRHVAEAFRARLDETPIEPLAVNEGRVSFVAGPREITTLVLRV